MFLSGIITKKVDNSTVSVEIKKIMRHRVYGKSILRTKKILAHDILNNFLVGDIVIIYKARLISKSKSWVIVR